MDRHAGKIPRLPALTVGIHGIEAIIILIVCESTLAKGQNSGQLRDSSTIQSRSRVLDEHFHGSPGAPLLRRENGQGHGNRSGIRYNAGTSASLVHMDGGHASSKIRSVRSIARQRRVHDLLAVGIGKSGDEPTQGLCWQTNWAEWSECVQGLPTGKMRASVNQINSLDVCVKFASTKCPNIARYVSYSPLGKDDVCAWYRECDMAALHVGTEAGDDYSHYQSVNVWSSDVQKTVRFANDEWPGMAECLDCALPLKILVGSQQNPVLRDIFITSNSFREENSSTYGSRGNMRVSRIDERRESWCGKTLAEMSAREQSGGWYLQYEFPSRVYVKEILTQGHATDPLYVDKFFLSTSDDGASWRPYGEHVEGETEQKETDFDCENGGAPCNLHAPTRIALDPPIVSRWLRINVKSYVGYPCLRAEIYGCRCAESVLPLHFEPTPLPETGAPQWKPWGQHLG